MVDCCELIDWLWWLCATSDMKVKHRFFFLRNYDIHCNEIEIYWNISWAHPSQGWGYISTKSVSLSTLFSTFAWDAVCRLHWTLCWSIRALHACCVSAFCHPQKRHLLGSSFRGLNMEVEGLWIWAVGRIRENFSSYCCGCLSCARTGVWSGVVMREGARLISLFGQTLKIHCSNLLNFCSYWSELIVALLAKNLACQPCLWSLWLLPRLVIRWGTWHHCPFDSS